MSSDQEATSKWKCINPECGIGIPYNPTYPMDNVLCSSCAAQDNAKRLLNNYKWSHRT